MGKKPALYKGKRHKDGGIPEVVVETGQEIEVETGEYRLCRALMECNDIFTFENKTSREILDALHSKSECEFKQGQIHAEDFIICRNAVLHKEKLTVSGTPKEIVNILQGKHGCKVEGGESFMLKGGGQVPKSEATKEALIHVDTLNKIKQGEIKTPEDLGASLAADHEKMEDIKATSTYVKFGYPMMENGGTILPYEEREKLENEIRADLNKMPANELAAVWNEHNEEKKTAKDIDALPQMYVNALTKKLFTQKLKALGQPIYKDGGQVTGYGCLMLGVAHPDWDKVISGISKEDIYDKEGFGVETEPHITLLYGFYDDETNPQDVFKETQKIIGRPIRIDTTGISIFESEEYDVVKLDIDSELLHKTNTALRSAFKHKETFPDYHPHATIAYVKKGQGKKYIRKWNKYKEPILFIGTEIIYSHPNESYSGTGNKKEIIKLTEHKDGVIWGHKEIHFADYDEVREYCLKNCDKSKTTEDLHTLVGHDNKKYIFARKNASGILYRLEKATLKDKLNHFISLLD